MNKETLNIHKALSEIKILNNRIPEKIQSLNVVASVKAASPNIYGESVEDWTKNARAGWDSVIDLIRRRDALKRAINKSNAATMVVIAGKEYSIAEAIDMKQNGITYLESLLRRIQGQYSEICRAVETNNRIADADATAFASNCVNGKNKETQTSATEIETVRKTYYDQHKSVLVDAVDIPRRMEALRNQIDGFVSEVDSAISVSNATTLITIEY